MKITDRLQRREVLLAEWDHRCDQVIACAEQEDVEAMGRALTARAEVLDRIMKDHRDYQWSGTDLARMRAREDQVEAAVAACHARLRDQVTQGRRRQSALSRYAEHR